MSTSPTALAHAAVLRKLLADEKTPAERIGVFAFLLGTCGGPAYATFLASALKQNPLPERVLLARFRAAGLERELGQRERDLLRGLFARHRGSVRAVAAELGIEAEDVHRLLRERGLTAEIEALRDRFRDQARNRRWPKEQIEQLLRRREWLEDLGIAAERERDVLSRARPAWERSGGSPARRASTRPHATGWDCASPPWA